MALFLKLPRPFPKDPGNYFLPHEYRASQVVLVLKNLPAKAGDIKDVDLIPGLGRSPGGGHGNPLQYSCLDNSMGGL